MCKPGKKALARLADLEKRMDAETAARAEQGAKIDAIFAFIQNMSTPPRPATAHSATPHARGEEPAQKRSKRSRRSSDQDQWVTLPQPAGRPDGSDTEKESSVKDHEEKKGRKGPRKKTTKTVARKRALQRGGQN